MDAITQADFPAGFAPVPDMDPGECATVAVWANAYVPEGAYHLGAIVDPNGWMPELIEANNAAAGTLLGIGYQPDLVVSAVSGPSSVQPGVTFEASVTVCNQGTTPNYGTNIDVLLSLDASIAPPDFPAGSAPVSWLGPGDCTTLTVLTDAYVPSGSYVIGAIVDAYMNVPELIETNNATAGNPLDVAY